MRILDGVAVSSGIGIGKLVVIPEFDFDISKKNINKDDIENEIKKVEDTISKLIEILSNRLKDIKDEQSEILKSHIILLEDPVIISDIKKSIESENSNCEYSINKIFEKYYDMFFSSGDELFMERAADLRDIKINLLTLLLGMDLFEISSVPKNSVLYARELTTTIAAGINPENIQGIITKEGGATSHMAIIAKSLALPCVVGIDNFEYSDFAIIDGELGKVYLSPDDSTIKEYKKKKEVLEKEKSILKDYIGLESLTLCGKHIELCCNIGLESEIEKASYGDSEGIGLFRTEFLYMNRNYAPSEDEQFAIYKKAAQSFKNKPVIIRTLDVGGDKEIKYLGIEKEENPFLGFRAIRYCLDNISLFSMQLRAILRASNYGNIKIMLPFISQVSEIINSRELISKIMIELSEKNIPYNKDIKIGVMIETPSAALMASQIAKYSDFFSIGTNDLTQYTMAVDRGNQSVSKIYSDYQPAVLNSIFNISKAAKLHNIPCGICGESASNPILTKFFIAIGITELSMANSSILNIKRIIRNTDYKLVKSKVETGIANLVDINDTIDFLKKL